jgi:hypothetical protein
VNKKVDGQRKRKPEKKRKGEGQGAKREKEKGRVTGGIITGVKLGIKEKRQEKGGEGCMERKVHIGNKWWKIRTRYSKEMEDNKKTCRRRKRKQGRSYTLGRGIQREKRRKRSKKLGRGEGAWEKKIQRQGGKCRGEETDGMDRRKWMGGIEREQTRGRRRRMDLCK